VCRAGVFPYRVLPHQCSSLLLQDLFQGVLVRAPPCRQLGIFALTQRTLRDNAVRFARHLHLHGRIIADRQLTVLQCGAMLRVSHTFSRAIKAMRRCSSSMIARFSRRRASSSDDSDSAFSTS
jgi:hypothetical protein